MQNTFNRRLILAVLNEPDESDVVRPRSAWIVQDMLQDAFDYKWDGIYEQMKTVPNKPQVHRTLKDLWNDGLIVASRTKEDMQYNLPRWIIHYQLSEGIDERGLISDLEDANRPAEFDFTGLFS